MKYQRAAANLSSFLSTRPSQEECRAEHEGLPGRTEGGFSTSRPASNGDKAAIRLFRVKVPEESLTDLRRHLRATPIAGAWDELTRRRGYKRYVSQGGGWNGDPAPIQGCL
jgi:hypothetical protein